jgi:hypothetical protein
MRNKNNQGDRVNYSDDLILLEITFISGRPKEKRLGLLKALNGGG